MTSKTSNKHDAFFRGNMDAVTVGALLDLGLDQTVCRHLKTGELDPVPADIVDTELNQVVTDLAFKTPLADTETMTYLMLDHKSEGALKRPLLPLPLLMAKQKTKMMEKLFREEGKLFKIFPVVVYHGSGAYRGARRLCDLMDPLPDDLLDGIDQNEVLLIDLDSLDPASLKGNPRLKVILTILRHYYREDIETRFLELIDSFKELEQRGDKALIVSSFEYLYRNPILNNDETFHRVALELEEETRGEVMSVAEQLEARGEKKGKIDGKEETR